MSDRMGIREMISLCYEYSEVTPLQVRIVAHEVLEEMEFIDYVNLYDHNPRKLHRISCVGGTWKHIF